jgi:hypothetical protein
MAAFLTNVLNSTASDRSTMKRSELGVWKEEVTGCFDFENINIPFTD